MRFAGGGSPLFGRVTEPCLQQLVSNHVSPAETTSFAIRCFDASLSAEAIVQFVYFTNAMSDRDGGAYNPGGKRTGGQADRSFCRQNASRCLMDVKWIGRLTSNGMLRDGEWRQRDRSFDIVRHLRTKHSRRAMREIQKAAAGCLERSLNVSRETFRHRAPPTCGVITARRPTARYCAGEHLRMRGDHRT